MAEQSAHNRLVVGSNPTGPNLCEVIKMAEVKSVEDILKQIDEFEKTLQSLGKNVASLKQKMLENKEKYGSDIQKWPKEAK
jgi:hypothetical protein